MHTHMIKYNQKGVEEALESLKTGYGCAAILTTLWEDIFNARYRCWNSDTEGS